LDFGSPPVSPFFPAITTLPYPDDDAPRDDPPSLVSPAAYADALRTSAAAFHRFAASHHTYVQKTTADRLNKHGIPAHFVLGDRIKIYMPPTHAQLQRTGRRAQHIVTWRGPCIITEITAITKANASLHYLGTTNPRLDRAVFKLLWLSPANKTVLKDTRPARNHLPITGKISVEDLPDLHVVTHLSLIAAGRLSHLSS
jgi:hypothetical protein